MTSLPNNPNTILKGGQNSVWQQIKGRYIRCIDDSASTQGGSNTVTLTVDNLPSHNHSGATAGNGKHTHTRGTMDIVGTFDPWSANNEAWGFASKATGTGALYSIDGGSKGKHLGQTTNQYQRYKLGFQASKGWTGNTSEAANHTHNIPAQGNNVPITIEPQYQAFYVWERIS